MGVILTGKNGASSEELNSRPVNGWIKNSAMQEDNH